MAVRSHQQRESVLSSSPWDACGGRLVLIVGRHITISRLSSSYSPLRHWRCVAQLDPPPAHPIEGLLVVVYSSFYFFSFCFLLKVCASTAPALQSCSKIYRSWTTRGSLQSTTAGLVHSRSSAARTCGAVPMSRVQPNQGDIKRSRMPAESQK